MLLRPEGEAIVAIGQTSHAWMAGQLARAWGGVRFPRPEPFEAVCLGAVQHDIGMAEWDLVPARDPATGLPRPYHDVDRRTHLALWTRAPRLLLSQSTYAALLTSLHGTGLYERYPPRTDDPAVAAAVAAFFADQRALQARLVAELGIGIGDDELAVNRALLAAWDMLSIALCEGHDRRVVPGVPSTHGPVTLTVERQGDHHTLDPWPMAADEVVVLGEGRRLTGPSPDTPSLHAALAAAPRVDLCFVLRRPRRSTQTG